MARDVELLDYLPPVLHDFKEILEITKVETPVLEKLWEEVESTLDNQFVITANEHGTARYESMLKLAAGESETIETRRFRILTRYQEQAPYTYKVLKQLLDSLLGEGQYVLSRNVSEKWLKVRMELTVSRQFDVVKIMLDRMTPQNTELIIEMRYNQHSLLSRYTHAQLSQLTHEQLRNEVLN